MIDPANNYFIQVLVFLQSFPGQKFYLSGSRSYTYGSPPDPTSDYDFVTQDTPEVRLVLPKLGFRRVPTFNAIYGEQVRDINTVEIYKHEKCSPEIDVILCLDVEARLLVTKHFVDSGQIDIVRKDSQFMWDAAYRKLLPEKFSTEKSLKAPVSDVGACDLCGRFTEDVDPVSDQHRCSTCIPL